MACKSAAHLKINARKRKNNENAVEQGKTALSHSMKIDLTPLLIAGGSGFEKIPFFYFYEGKA